MRALAVILIAAGLGVALIEWGREHAANVGRAIVEAFENDVVDDLEERLEDDE